MIRLAVFMMIMGAPALADILVAARTIPAHHRITADDLARADIEHPNGVTDPLQIVGQEAGAALFRGHVITAADLRPAAVVERNEVLTLVFDSGGLMIATDGRALDRGAPGDLIRVMNLSSRKTVSAVVSADGRAIVGHRG